MTARGWARWLWILGLAMALCLAVACEDDDDSDDGDEGGHGDNDPPTEDDDDDAAGLSGWRIDFTFEYEGVGSLVMWEEEGKVVGHLATSLSTDTLAAGVVIEGEGGFVDYPESGYKALKMTFAGPATFNRCGDQPLTYSLFMTYRGDNGFLYGGLTTYCGEGVTYGRPVQLMRLMGNLERTEIE